MHMTPELEGIVPVAPTPFDEKGRIEASIATIVAFEGFAFPDILVGVYRRFQAGDRAGAAAVFDRYASLIRYEGQEGIGLALRKEILRRRGAIRTAALRAPAPALDEVTRAELDDLVRRLGVDH